QAAGNPDFVDDIRLEPGQLGDHEPTAPYDGQHEIDVRLARQAAPHAEGCPVHLASERAVETCEVTGIRAREGHGNKAGPVLHRKWLDHVVEQHQGRCQKELNVNLGVAAFFLRESDIYEEALVEPSAIESSALHAFHRGIPQLFRR